MVEDYIACGFSLTPLNGKVPIRRGWQNTVFNPSLTLNELGNGNFGVVLKEDDLVIDVDPRNFKNGISSITKLMLEAGIEHFNTFTVRTGGGGLHIYLKKPLEVILAQLPKRFPGIEFKSKGSQVVGATCTHPDTNLTYDVLPGILHIKDIDLVLKK